MQEQSADMSGWGEVWDWGDDVKSTKNQYKVKNDPAEMRKGRLLRRTSKIS